MYKCEKCGTTSEVPAKCPMCGADMTEVKPVQQAGEVKPAESTTPPEQPTPPATPMPPAAV